MTNKLSGEAYAKRQDASRPLSGDSFTFPDTGEAGESFVQLPFQPLGISRLGDTIYVANYFDPSFMMAEVSFERGLPCLNNIRHVRGTLPRREIRMFPDVCQPVGANRMQAVIPYSHDHLGLTRNEDNQIFNIRLQKDGAWQHESATYLKQGGRGGDPITSIKHTRDGFVTIEIDGKGECWLRDYRNELFAEEQIPTNRYGLDILDDGTIVTIADYRAKEHGIFFGKECRTPGFYGNGIACLPNGGALTTLYGGSVPSPFGGIPGELQYIPPELLK